VTDHLRPHDAALERLKALHPRAIDLSLGRTLRLLDALGRPQDRLPPVVHVAGTNGKGSTVAFVRAIAEAAGLRVHVFTSPHLVRFAERIRLAGTLIGDDALAEVLARTERANAGDSITFFEVTTAAALLAFSESPADLLLLEVGLGGRYDATNVVDRPAVSVIAPVDLDHQEFLGSDLAGIAREKAGILKPGRPGVIGRQNEPALEAIEAEAERVGAALTVMGRDFDAWAERGGLAVQHAAGLLDLPAPALPGPHQIDNAGLAVAAALALNDPRITSEAIAAGVAGAVWSARMQRLTAGPFGEAARARGADLWLDGGHNPHAARALAAAVARLAARDGRPTVLIAGLLANKDAQGWFKAWREVRPEVLTVDGYAEAAASAGGLAKVAEELGFIAAHIGSLDAALTRALAGDGPPPRVVIAGSLYLASEVLSRTPETWPT
jgi:dihydrofolate synthase/folylpolyglutamate synthase